MIATRIANVRRDGGGAFTATAAKKNMGPISSWNSNNEPSTSRVTPILSSTKNITITNKKKYKMHGRRDGFFNRIQHEKINMIKG
jgi:hypothetical protein